MGRDNQVPPIDGGAEAGAFFGRRKGKRLRAGQAQRQSDLLPRLRVPLDQRHTTLDPYRLFPHEPDEIWLEIGFGGGEHLAEQAARHRSVGIVGCEPFINGVVKLLRAIEDGGLENVRIWDEDATALLEALPDGCLTRVYLLYPDPWPKRRQRKRRFVSERTLGQIARVLKPGGLFRFATDIDDYAGWTLMQAAANPSLDWTAGHADDWRRPWSEWVRTRYEAKAMAAGRRPSYLEFARRPDRTEVV